MIDKKECRINNRFYMERWTANSSDTLKSKSGEEPLLQPPDFS